MQLQDYYVAAGILLAAILYSSVGHAGASGYLAVMALASIPQASMKPTALVLNVFVAVIGTIRFASAGHFRWRTFWPFALGSVPLAFLGGKMKLPEQAYKYILGTVLVLAAIRMMLQVREPAEKKDVPIQLGLMLGAIIGLLSGMTGVGGGIFLSPVLLFAGWAGMRQTAATSVVFILVNSIAGLAGLLTSPQKLPSELPIWIGVAATGGFVGSTLGAKHLNTLVLKRLLALVLLIAGAKMLLT